MTLTPIVVDSSVIIKWLSQDRENYLKESDKILEDAQNNKIILIAPELAKYEAGNVLLVGKHLSIEQAKIVLSRFYELPLSFISESKELSETTFKLAYDLGITYYDASFLSIAEKYGASLVTENIKHQGKALDIKVTALKDYNSN